MSFTRPVLFLGALLMAAACSPEEPGGTGGTGGAGGEEPCPTGSVAGLDGACLAVGIQSCPGRFIGEDGLCHPSMAKCADEPGTIPRFGDPTYEGGGCEPAGIPVAQCPARFMEGDGSCHPSMAKCADEPGTIPRFGDPDYTGDGCEPAGIPDCAPELLEDDGLCHPSMTKCPEGTFAVPQGGCVPIDGPEGCGDGTWGNIEDGLNTIYVDGGAAASGDGSKAGPVKTLAEALALAPEGGRIAIAAGVYDEPVHITTGGLTLEGRCPSMVRIQGTTAAMGSPAVVAVDGADGVTVRRVEAGGAGFGVLAVDSAQLVLEEVHVRGASIAGISINGPSAVASIHRSLVEGTLPDPADQLGGYGVTAGYGAFAAVSDSAIVENLTAGLAAFDAGSTLESVNSLIESTQSSAFSGKYGQGALAAAGAALKLDRTALKANHESAIFAYGESTMLTMTASLVEETLPRPLDGRGGNGLILQEGARATLEKIGVRGTRTGGVSAFQAGTVLVVTESLVEGTLPRQADGLLGYGVLSSMGAELTISGSTVAGNSYGGLVADMEATTLTASATLVEGTKLGPEQTLSAAGAAAQKGAGMTLTAVALVANDDVGLATLGEGTQVIARETLVEGTHPAQPDGEVGAAISRGVGAQEGGRLELIGSALLTNTGAGLMLTDAGTEVIVTGTLVRGTLPAPGTYGAGALVFEQGRLAVTGSAIFENRSAGIHISGEGADVTLDGALIEGTLPFSDGQQGMGIAASGGVHVAATSTAVVGNRLAGVTVLGAAARLDLVSMLVEGTLPQEVDGLWGQGIVLDQVQDAKIASTLVQDNVVSGIVAANAKATLSDIAVEGVSPGGFLLFDTGRMYQDAGDGVVATRGSTLDVVRARVRGCSRAGLLFDASSGSLSGVTSTNNGCGLVLQGSPLPVYEGAGNEFSGNTDQGICDGGDMTVASDSPPIPPADPG